MATNFPTSIDSFTNPTSGDTLDSPSHAAQHTNINDAMVAVQTKLGVGSGTIGTWTTFTPTLTATTTNPTLGTGSIKEGFYTVINEIMIVQVYFRFGSSGASAGSGSYRISTPSGFTLGASQNNLGWAWLFDQNVATGHGAIFDRVADESVRMYLYQNPIEVGNANPFTWSNNDQIRGTMIARLA